MQRDLNHTKFNIENATMPVQEMGLQIDFNRVNTMEDVRNILKFMYKPIMVPVNNNGTPMLSLNNIDLVKDYMPCFDKPKKEPEIIKVPRMVKANEQNPNGYFYIDMEEALVKFLEEAKKYGMNYVVSYSNPSKEELSDIVVIDLCDVIGKVESFDDDSFYIKLNDNGLKYYNSLKNPVIYVYSIGDWGSSKNVQVTKIIKISLADKGE